MNPWKTKAGRFTDGKQSIGIEVAFDLVTSTVPIHKLAERLKWTQKHFADFAVVVCKVLIVEEHRVKYWKKIRRKTR